MPIYMSFGAKSTNLIKNKEIKRGNFSNSIVEDFTKQFLNNRKEEDNKFVKKRIGDLITYINENDEKTIMANLSDLEDMIIEEFSTRFKKSKTNIGNVIQHFGLYPYLNNFSNVEDLQLICDCCSCCNDCGNNQAIVITSDEEQEAINKVIKECLNTVSQRYIVEDKKDLLRKHEFETIRKPINIGKLECLIANSQSEGELQKVIENCYCNLVEEDLEFMQSNNILGDTILTEEILGFVEHKSFSRISEKIFRKNFATSSKIPLPRLDKLLYGAETQFVDFNQNNTWMFIFNKKIDNKNRVVIRKFGSNIPFRFSGMTEQEIMSLMKQDEFIYHIEEFVSTFDSEKKIKEIISFEQLKTNLSN